MTLTFTDPSLAYDINAPLMIEASAGSGKTTILTERWVAVFLFLLAWEDLDPSHALASMAALTFTRKAAAEMKERIRARLDQLFAGQELEELLEQIQKYQSLKINITHKARLIRSQKSSIDDMISAAQIGTIDAFILAALRQNPLELQEERPFAPDEDSLYEAEVQRALIHSCLSGAAPSPLQEAFQKGAGLCGFRPWIDFLATLRKKAASMGEDSFLQHLTASGFLRQSEEILALSLEDIYTRFLQDPVRQLSAALEAEVIYDKQKKGSKSDPSNPMEGLTSNGREIFSILQELDEHSSALLFQSKLFPSYKTAAVKDEELQGLRESSKKASERLADTCTDLALSLMMPIFFACSRHKQKLRDEEGISSFSENAQRFLEALRQGAMAEKIQENLRYFFADEFQDTSPQQYAIFEEISRKAVPFYVGDPKQSIFRFRGADAEVFQRAAAGFQSKGWRTAVLSENRRSVPSHVNFVNKVFQHVFAEGAITYNPQKSLKEGEGSLAYTHALPPKDGQKKAAAPDIKDQSFQEALSFIREDIARYQSPGRILVLFHTGNEIKEFYYFLKKEAPDLPISSSKKEGLFQSAPIKPLLAFLRALDNPFDEQRLITLLKGIFFRKDDREITTLLEEARNRNLSLFECLPPSDQSRLNQYLSLKDRAPLSELMEYFLEDSAYEILLAQESGESLATLRLFREELRGLELQGGLTLESFLDIVDQNKLDRTEAEFSGGQGKNIRLMTVHSSKGLESPCVIYVYRNGLLLNSQNMYPLASGGRIAFNNFGQGSLVSELKSLEKQEALAERRRLTYVALTRARESFYLCGLPLEHPEGALSQELFALCVPEALRTEPLRGSRSDIHVPSEEGYDYEARRDFLNAHEQTYTLQPRHLSVSRLLDAEFSPGLFRRRSFGFSDSLRDLGEGESAFALPSAADIGTMVHKVLQKFDAMEGVDKYLLLYFPQFQEAFDTVKALAGNYWNSSFFQGIGSAPREKERIVQMLLPQGILLRSSADLYIAGGRQSIVDYKLSVGANRERFRRQLSYYGFLSEEAGFPIDELVLFDLKTGEADIFLYDAPKTKTAFYEAVEKATKLLKDG